jgi:secondary thiamine-phosphate synthase enzyme
MTVAQECISMRTAGRGAYDITAQVARIVSDCRIGVGTCHVFARHTSASLIVCENADPQVLLDLEAFLGRLVPDGDRLFRHTAEGRDDMPAHIRSVLTQPSIVLPVNAGALRLGTWQGIFLYEHRTAAHTRQVIVTVQGE